MEALPADKGRERTPQLRTFLISDIRDYTRFTAEHGDAAAAHLATTFAGLSRDAVEARGGRVIELRGDEALAVFDVAAQAVRAALELQAICAEEVATDPSWPLLVGVGIATGEAVPVEEGFRGAALNLAARLCSMAAAGQVLVSEWIADLAGQIEGISIQKRGSVELKGFPKPIAYLEASADPAQPQLVPSGAVVPGGLPPELDVDLPLVAREHEMRWARGTWRQARRGAGRVVVVSGPTGIGKTRLAAEIAAHVQETGGTLRYAGAGGTAIADTLAAIEIGRAATSPTFVILDDLDAVGEQAASALAQALEEIQRHPTMVFALVQRDDAIAPLGVLVEVLDVRGDGHRVLGPLDAVGVREICRIYAGEDVAEAPIESIARSSRGVPGRVHEAMSGWAREEATRRLEAAAEWLTAGRERRASDLGFANNVIGLKLDRIYRVPGASDEKSTCPYKGLAAYGEDDARFFFGREGVVGELAARTVGVGLLGVIGASGSGKSSVVAAGLRSSLAAGLLPGSARWRQVSIRPGEHPMTEVRRAIGDLAPGMGEDDPVGWATDALAPDERLVICVDQFEEVFTTCLDEDEASSFVQALMHASSRPERAVVVLSLRGDFYGDTAAYPALAEALTANHVLIGPMSHEDLRRAVELPARRTGLRVETALVDRLVEEATDAPGGLPLLSTALTELWGQREDGWIRLDAYDRTGGLRGAVARLAEQTFSELTDVEKEAAPALFLRLVGPGEGDAVTRRRVPVEEFDSQTDPVAAELLSRFTQDRLLTVDEGTVEVAHEALLREWPRLGTWLAEDAQGRELRAHITRAARTWENAEEEDSELYRGARLSAALDWADVHDPQLNEVERRFLNAGRQAGERENARQRRTNRRLRGLLAGVAVFLVLALVAASVAFVQRGSAQRASIVADARRLATQSLAEDHLDRSILLALAAVRLDDSVESRGALFASLLKSPAAIGVMNSNQGLSGLSLSPDGKTLAVVGDNGDLALFNTASRGPIGEPIRRVGLPGGSPPKVAYSPTGRSIAVTEYTYGTGGSFDVIDTDTGQRTLHKRLGANTYADSIAFSPNGRVVAAADRTYSDPTNADLIRKEIVLFDARTGHRLERLALNLKQGFPTQVAFLPGGRRLVSSTYHTITVVWNLRSREILRRFHLGGALAVSPDGETVAVGNFDGSVVLRDLRTGASRPMDGLQTQRVDALAFTADGRTLLSGGGDGNVMAWDVGSGGLRETWAGSGQISGVVASPDGGTAYSTSEDGTLLIWDLSGDHRLGRRFDVGAGPGDNVTFAVSAYAQVLAVSRAGEGIDLWDLQSLSRLGKLRTINGGEAFGVALSPDGRVLVTNGVDGNVARWDLAKRSMIGGPARATKGIGYSAAFSPDGRMFATSGDATPEGKTGKFIVWDANTGERLHTFTLRGSPLGPSPLGETFSTDGRFLAGQTDKQAAVWNVASGQRMLFVKKDNIAQQAVFTPDGRSVTFANNDKTMTFRNLETGNQVAPPLQGLAGSQIDVSPDRTELASSGNHAGLVQLWDLTTREQIGPNLPGPTNVETTDIQARATFTADGNHLLAVYGDGTAILWDVNPAAWEARACTVAGRSLSQNEWSDLLPNQPYQQLCP